MKKAKQKPWYKNTVFVIMSDHCASSAGRWELDVNNYHIPALIFNSPNIQPEKVNTLASQIDVFPTLFSVLNWDYTSNFFGKNILTMQPEDERAFIGNYRKLGYLKDNKVMVLDEQKNSHFYLCNPLDNSQKLIPTDKDFEHRSISFYQVADGLYRNGKLKIKE